MSRIASFDSAQSAIPLSGSDATTHITTSDGASVGLHRGAEGQAFAALVASIYNLAPAEVALVAASPALASQRQAFERGARDIAFPRSVSVPDPHAAPTPTQTAPTAVQADAPQFQVPSTLPSAATRQTAPSFPRGLAPAGDAFNRAPAAVRAQIFSLAEQYRETHQLPFTVRLSDAQTSELRTLLMQSPAVAAYAGHLSAEQATLFFNGCAALARTAPETTSFDLGHLDLNQLLPALSQLDLLSSTTHDSHRCVPSSILGAALQRGWTHAQDLFRHVLADPRATRLSAEDRQFLSALAERGSGSIALGELHYAQDLMWRVLDDRDGSAGMTFDAAMLQSAGFTPRGELMRAGDGPHDLPAHAPPVTGLADGETLLLGVHTTGGTGHAFSVTRHGDGYVIYDTGQMMRPPTRTCASLAEAYSAMAEAQPRGLGAVDWMRALVIAR